MSKFYSKLAYGFVASTAFLCSSGAFAQVCNATSVGAYTEVVDADGNSWYTLDIDDGFGNVTPGIDTNGGFGYIDAVTGAQIENRFTELGTHSAGASLRVNGFTGNFNSTDPFDTGLELDKRDLDYMHMKVNSACYLIMDLSMNDKNGDPILAESSTYSAFQFYRWADPIADPYGELAGDGSAGNDFFYGDFGYECPQLMEYVLPNGVTQARFSVPAGDIIFTVYVPFDSQAGGTRTLEGPMAWGLNIDITGYDYATCGSTVATNDCITISNQGGCSDGQCCDTVCGGGFSACCDVVWDASCLQNGVELCGNFIYSCANPSSDVGNDCVAGAELISTFPSTVSFDNTTATQDGPNDVTRLCISQMKHDLWYVVGPAPANGELTISMCGLGNPTAIDTNGDGELDDFPADSVLNVFYLGADSTVPNPQDLPSLYIGCSDDNCIDSGAVDPDTGLPVVDLGGSSAVRVTGVDAGDYVLVAVGQYDAVTDDGTTTSPEGFMASMAVDFTPVWVDNGLQTYALENGGGVNVGLISGAASEANPKRWIFVPFTMANEGSVSKFDFAGGGGPDTGLQPNVVQYKIIARDTNGGAYGASKRPFVDGIFDASQVLFEGSEAFDVTDFYDIGDQCSSGCGRYFVDLTTPFTLPAGEYYFTIYGDDADGGATWFSWLMYGEKSMAQVTTSAVNIPASEAANPEFFGDFAANTAFGWRGIGAEPKLCFYTLGPTYASRTDLPPGILYGCAFNLGGVLNQAPPCPTDLNGDLATDSADLGQLLGSFGEVALGTPGDFNDDLSIDSSDLGTMLGSFGDCPTE